MRNSSSKAISINNWLRKFKDQIKKARRAGQHNVVEDLQRKIKAAQNTLR